MFLGACAVVPARHIGLTISHEEKDREVMSGSSKSPWLKLPPTQQHERARDLHTLYSRRQLEAVLHRERARADRNNC